MAVVRPSGYRPSAVVRTASCEKPDKPRLPRRYPRRRRLDPAARRRGSGRTRPRSGARAAPVGEGSARSRASAPARARPSGRPWPPAWPGRPRGVRRPPAGRRRRRGRTAARSASGPPGPGGHRGRGPPPEARWRLPPAASGRRSHGCRCGRTGRRPRRSGRGRHPLAGPGRPRRPRRRPEWPCRHPGSARRRRPRRAAGVARRGPRAGPAPSPARGGPRSRPRPRRAVRVRGAARAFPRRHATGVEELGIDAARPQGSAGHAMRVELGQRRRRRCQGGSAMPWIRRTQRQAARAAPRPKAPRRAG